MADIEIKCPKCEQVTVVSEFVDAEAISCRSCGEKLQKPEIAPAKPKATVATIKKPALKLAQTEKVAEAPQQPLKHVVQAVVTKKEESDEPRRGITQNVVAWIIFVVLAAVFAYLRYFSANTSSFIGYSLTYGPYVVIGFHVLITLKAFKDAFFQGVLCLLVPCYSMYYIFLVSDDFFLRAVVAGMLVGLGQDSAMFFHAKSITMIDTVNSWISSGG